MAKQPKLYAPQAPPAREDYASPGQTDATASVAPTPQDDTSLNPLGAKRPNAGAGLTQGALAGVISTGAGAALGVPVAGLAGAAAALPLVADAGAHVARDIYHDTDTSAEAQTRAQSRVRDMGSHLGVARDASHQEVMDGINKKFF